MSTKFSVVIGKNFGDEGKGRVTNILSERPGKGLVIRHNGGAQSGHTVVIPSNENADDKLPQADLLKKRFIFHEVGSGSFCGADTLWIDTFFPDLFKLREEVDSFIEVSGVVPRIYSLSDTNATIVCDVLFNMALETVRGTNRHGSCGMGIYEAYLRTKNGFGLTVEKIKTLSEDELYSELVHIRDYYYRPRIGEIFGGTGNSQYLEDILNNVVLKNAAFEMKRNAEYVDVLQSDVVSFLGKYENVIFESGQGLLLDSENTRYAPHVTGSRTGITNPAAFLDRFGLKIDEVIYVTRSYITRHGAGELPFECDKKALGDVENDTTNVENPWQGAIRYAPHASINEFLDPVIMDLMQLSYRPKVICAVTHLSETEGRIIFQDRESDITASELGNNKEVSMVIDEFWELS
ncbi:MAG: adenylosuccinate synthetase [Butyrivibrio sp.]|nr:adenylosuccinate synthetase [Butyrivibrio sp.]